MTTVDIKVNRTQSRSQFVTVLAWFSIVVSALMVLGSAMQNIMLNLFFPPDALRSLSEADAKILPPFTVFLFTHFKAIILGFFVLSVIVLVSSIGLLRRKNWARLAFIALLAASIAWTISSVFVQQSMFTSLARFEGPEAKRIEDVMWVFKGVMVAFAVVFTAVHGWLIYKLCLPAIRAEFS